MNTEEALLSLGVNRESLTPEQIASLQNQGYFVVDNCFDSNTIERLRDAYDRCASSATTVEFSGRRFGGAGPVMAIEKESVFILDLFNKSPDFDELLTIRPMLAAAQQLLGEIKVFSLNGRSPGKGKGQQALHSDAPKQHGTDWRIVNTLIPLDQLTDENGATRLIPGSHLWPALNVPLENIGADIFPDPMGEATFPIDAMLEHPEEIRLHLEPGSIAVLNAHLWHGGTTNVSGCPRRLFHMTLCRRDTPQEYSQRDLVTEALWERSSPAQKYLLDIENSE